MSTEEKLFDRAVELQAAINELAEDYFAEMKRQAEQAERFRRMADMLGELRKLRSLAKAGNKTLPDLLTDDAEEAHAAMVRHGIFRGESTPPADCSAN